MCLFSSDKIRCQPPINITSRDMTPIFIPIQTLQVTGWKPHQFSLLAEDTRRSPEVTTISEGVFIMMTPFLWSNL